MLTAKIDAASGTTAIVAGVAGRRIRVLGYLMVAAGSVTATWKSGSTALTGAMTMAAGAPLPWSPPSGMDVVPALECAPSEDLNLTLSGSVQVSGHLVYELVS